MENSFYNFDNVYINNFIVFFFSYGLFSFYQSIVLLVLQKSKTLEDKSTQLSEIENETIVLKKRKLI